MSLRNCLAISALLWAAACAVSPLDTAGREVSAIGPAHVLDDPARIGETVVWGGRIAEIINLVDATELIVVSYPLDHGDRPRVRAEGGVRFIGLRPGYLEPLNFTPGRFVTVLGHVTGIEKRPVGEFTYDHPVMEVEQLHLWPVDPAAWYSRTRIGIGVGIRL